MLGKSIIQRLIKVLFNVYKSVIQRLAKCCVTLYKCNEQYGLSSMAILLLISSKNRMVLKGRIYRQAWILMGGR